MAHTHAVLRGFLARLARAGILCLLVALVGDAATVVRLCASDAHGCGDACAMCWCRRDAASTRLRTECPCCRRSGAVPAAVSLEPAVLPSSPGVLPPAATTATRASDTRPAASFTPRVPHPPPRALFS